VTQRDLEAVAQQVAHELLKKSQKGVWPFKEERQLVRAAAHAASPRLWRPASCFAID
jgi:hypothetical protein